MDYNGILLINKPADITSFKVCEIVRKKFKIKKVGHGGTLDPFATGLLILGIGKGTKLMQIISQHNKEYSGKMILGEKKDTFDFTGKTILKADDEKLKKLKEDDILAIRNKFTGVIKQKPPQFSALKKNGKPLYEYARKGEFVELEYRTVFVEKFEITQINIPEVEFKIKCSKGTYIRSIANDLGEALGTFAYLKTLRRDSINGYYLDNAHELEGISKSDIIPFDNALNIRKTRIKREFSPLLENGNILQLNHIIFENNILEDGELVYVFGDKCSVVGVYSSEKKEIKPEIVYKKSLH